MAKYVLPVVTGNTRQKCEACDLLKSGEAVGSKVMQGKCTRVVQLLCDTAIMVSAPSVCSTQPVGNAVVVLLSPGVIMDKSGSGRAAGAGANGSNSAIPYFAPVQTTESRDRTQETLKTREPENVSPPSTLEAKGASRARPLQQQQITATSRRRALHRARKGLVCCCPIA